MACPGSIRMCEGVEETTSEFAEEGRRAHEVAEWALLHGSDAAIAAAGLGYSFPEDDLGAIQGYVERCREDGLSCVDVFVEQRVDFSPYALPNSFGTSDWTGVVKTHYSGYILRQKDFKFGKGVPVDAENSEQLMCYGLGTIEALDFIYEFDEVQLVIDQPRIHNQSEWCIRKDALVEWGNDVLKPAAEATLDPEAPLVPGGKQCKWCRAKDFCPAFAELTLSHAVAGFKDETAVAHPLKLVDVDGLTNEQVGFIMEHIELFKAFPKMIEARAFAEIERGNHIPGQKVVLGQKGNRRWQDEKAERKAQKAMQAHLREAGKSISEVWSKKLISPTGAERLLGKKAYNELLDDLVERPEGKPALVPEDDKRPALVYENPIDGFDDETKTEVIENG